MRIECRQTSKVRACCDACGEWPGLLHMPEERHGWYCPACCPVCGRHPGRLKAAPEIDYDSPAARVRD